jgi:hypothetical protein
MRITGKDKACGTVSSSRVDKMDFLITKTCPEAGEEEEESMAYIAIAKLYPTHKLSYTRMCIHYTYLSPYLSLRLYEISSMEYICSKSAICFVGFLPQGVFSCPYFFRRFIVLARQGFFNGWVGLLLQVSE